MEYSVLIVDSDSNTHTQISDVLKEQYRIEHIATAEDKESALTEMDNNNTIQCIFVSASFCEGTTCDFISNIRNKENYKNANIVMMSDVNDREALLKAAASGANDVITKPISSRSLSLKLKRIFKNKIFRTTERISLMGAVNADLLFDSGAKYTAQLIDISKGGCSTRSPLLTEGGAVYDTVQIVVENNQESLEIPAELIRIEKDPESEDSASKKLLLAFQIKGLKDNQQSDLNNFLNRLSNPET